MAESREPVTVVKVDYLCDACGASVQTTNKHRFRSFLGGAESDEVLWQHSCVCGRFVWLARKYPAIEYHTANE